MICSVFQLNFRKHLTVHPDRFFTFIAENKSRGIFSFKNVSLNKLTSFPRIPAIQYHGVFFSLRCNWLCDSCSLLYLIQRTLIDTEM